MTELDGLRDHLRQWGESVADNAAEQVREETARDAPYPFGERVTASNVTESGDVFSVMIGVEIEPFEWLYGDPSARINPFEPHEELGSREFLDVDDPDLANELTFPSVQFFTPHDHEGCLCETLPTSGDIANPWFADPLPERWRDALQQAAAQES